MTAITTIRIDHDALPTPLRHKTPDAVAEAIEAALLEVGISAEASDLFSHFKIELPTDKLAAAATVLAGMGLI
ncbi:hypothetical protein [Roseovarius sp. D22-M7]|uniref:hypothetical protein n=1 Tax=Roseovarius sp. D22-M7 TaxID=3127116 RepID=UPI00300FC45F